jgi:hypothetical protein
VESRKNDGCPMKKPNWEEGDKVMKVALSMSQE